jgi:hypothetical protein
VVFTEKTFRDYLKEWIITTDQPFTAVEHPSFQKMIKLCNADAKVPSATTVKNDIMNDFDHERGNIRTLLQV